MAGIRSANTRQELAIRKALHAAGLRYRLHPKDVPGKPDMALPRWRAAVFVNGCFWHGHDCSLFRLPGTRTDFWRAKIERNRARDAEVGRLIAEAGWRRITIWECAIRGPGSIGLSAVVERAAAWIRSDQGDCEIRGSRDGGC